MIQFSSQIYLEENYFFKEGVLNVLLDSLSGEWTATVYFTVVGLASHISPAVI